MLRTHWFTNSAAAKSYFAVSDYYSSVPGQWLGEGAERLGLEQLDATKAFHALCDNLDPNTGLPLTTYTREGRRVGMDLTFNSTKSVGIVREMGDANNLGDEQVEIAHREAVGRLKEIHRQRHRDYKKAIAAIAKGDILGGYDTLDKLGWIQQADSHKPLVDEYLAGLNAGKTMLVVAPTHWEGDAITGAIRKRLTQEGKLKDEHAVPRLSPVAWTEAEKGDLDRYDGTEVIQFVRNSGPFKAGQRVGVADLAACKKPPPSKHYAVYSPGEIGLSAGDSIRITAGGRSREGHRLDNGNEYTVKSVSEKGDVTLTNNWVIGNEFQHIAHNYVATSQRSQGKTVDRVLVALGHESLPAIRASTWYVSLTGRDIDRRSLTMALIIGYYPLIEIEKIIELTSRKRGGLYGQMHILRE